RPILIIGGDTNSSTSGTVIDCSLSGFSDSVVKRRGAKHGDLIGVSGNFGLQSSGLALLLGRAKSTDPSFRKRAEESVLNPNARLLLGLRISRYLSSCIDSSDGLALSLYHLAESSNVDMLLDSIPLAEGITEFASENALRTNDLALFGGEEYELVFTFDMRHAKALSREGIITIGRVVGTKKESYPSVYYLGKRIARRGWIHNA
ncbi:MAG: hypothetical protein M1368_07780, partial [Thaumarchaeota archaeon]|nr:hypothetical protein [Nitrososphaerota archaeon]